MEKNFHKKKRLKFSLFFFDNKTLAQFVNMLYICIEYSKNVGLETVSDVRERLSTVTRQNTGKTSVLGLTFFCFI